MCSQVKLIGCRQDALEVLLVDGLNAEALALLDQQHALEARVPFEIPEADELVKPFDELHVDQDPSRVVL